MQRKSLGYDRAQRAYVLACENPSQPTPLEFELAANEKSPIVNLAVVVKGWGRADPAVRTNGQSISSPEAFRFGHTSTLEQENLVLWIELESTEPLSVSVRPQR